MKPACIHFLCVNQNRNDCAIKTITDRTDFNLLLYFFYFYNDPIHLTSSHYVFVYMVGFRHCFIIAPLALLWCASRLRQCDDDDNYDDSGYCPALTGGRVCLPSLP